MGNLNSRSIYSQYNMKAFSPLPFIYQTCDGFKMPLSSFYDIIDNIPAVLSFGSPFIGKSKLLNQIFKTNFTEGKNDNIRNPIDVGVEIVGTSKNLMLNFNIFDLHMDPLANEDLLKEILLMMKHSLLLIQIVARRPILKV